MNSSPGYLNSWKEIARYLGVSVRTAQAWEERKGLPVRRLPPGSKSGVHAFAEELDAWKQAQANPSRGPRRWGSLITIAGTVGALALLVILSFLVDKMLFREKGPDPYRCTVEGQILKVYNAEGDLLWQTTPPGLRDGALMPIDAVGCIVTDSDKDGAGEVLLPYSFLVSPTGTGHIQKFAPDGRLQWTIELGRELEWAGRRFGRSYGPAWIQPVTLYDRAVLLVCAVQNPYFPTQIVLFDMESGALLAEYYHPGHLPRHLLVDTNGDGSQDLVLSGFNNPGPGPGHPVLFVLDLPSVGGSGDDANSSADFFGNASRLRLQTYIVLPRIDTCEKLEIPNNAAIVRFDSDRSRLIVDVDGGNVCGGVRFEFEVPGLRLLEIRPVGGFVERHQEMFDKGILDHELRETELQALSQVLRLDYVPNANSPELKQQYRQLRHP